MRGYNMEARVYDLGSMRLQRNTRTLMEKTFPMQLALDISALTINVTLCWVAYWRALGVFHARLLSLK